MTEQGITVSAFNAIGFHFFLSKKKNNRRNRERDYDLFVRSREIIYHFIDFIFSETEHKLNSFFFPFHFDTKQIEF